MTFAVDNAKAIRERLHEIRVQEGRPDDNWRTACGRDLDAIAAFYGVDRVNYESDYALRNKIEAVINRRMAR